MSQLLELNDYDLSDLRRYSEPVKDIKKEVFGYLPITSLKDILLEMLGVDLENHGKKKLDTSTIKKFTDIIVSIKIDKIHIKTWNVDARPAEKNIVNLPSSIDEGKVLEILYNALNSITVK